MDGPESGDRRVLQIAWLVPDLARAADAWARTTGIGPFLHAPHVVVDDLVHRGQSASIDFSVAIAQAGGVQIELVQQHCDRPSAYRDLLGNAQSGLHHIGIYSDTYETALARYVDQGHAIAVRGRLGNGRFTYIDTSAAIGCMIELIERDAGYDAFFGEVAARAKNWDGSGPALVEL